MDGIVTPEKREQILRQMQAQLVKMMGNVEGMEQHVRTWENQSYELSKGIEKDYIARMANRLQKIENKLKQQQLQQQQPTMQQQQQPQLQQPQHISQQQLPQHVLQPQAQSRFGPQQPQAQPHHGQVIPTIPTRVQGSSSVQQPDYGMYAMHDAHAGHSHQQPAHMDLQQPDSEIFADMAQAFILGPSDVAPPQQQQQQLQQQQQQTYQQQPAHQRSNVGYSSGATVFPPAQQVPMQTWQRQQQQQQQQQYGNNGGMQQLQSAYNPTQPQPFYNTTQTQYNQGSPASYGVQQHAHTYPQQQQQQRMHAQHQQQQQGAPAGSVVATEQYWTLLEEMRAEYLGDLEEYVGYARMNDRNPQPSDKMNKMLNIVARLSMRREQNLHREFTVKDVQVLQSLQQQLRMYVAKLRTILEALRKKRQETENAGLLQVLPTQGPGTPSEMQLAFPASTPYPTALQGGKQIPRVETPTTMPTPPGTSPGEAKVDMMGEAAAKAAWEKASATPTERLIRQLAGARAEKLAAAADAAKAVAMRIGSEFSSPPLPIRLKRPEPDAHDASRSQEQRVVRSFNIAKTGQPHSPDSVLDIRATSKRRRTQQERKALEALRQRIEAECSQLEASCGAKFHIRECEDVESALVISATVPLASAQQPQSSDAQGKAPPTSQQGSGKPNSAEVERVVLSRSSSSAHRQTGAGTWRRALHMRVDTEYPSQPPVLLFPETSAISPHDAKVTAFKEAFEEAIAAKAHGAHVDIQFLVETWATTLAEGKEIATAAV